MRMLLCAIALAFVTACSSAVVDECDLPTTDYRYSNCDEGKQDDTISGDSDGYTSSVSDRGEPERTAGGTSSTGPVSGNDDDSPAVDNTPESNDNSSSDDDNDDGPEDDTDDRRDRDRDRREDRRNGRWC